MRRWAGALLAIVILGIVGVIGYLAITEFSEDTATADDSDTPERPLATAAVVRTDLVSTDTLEGVLRYSDPGTLFASGSGTVTALPTGGDVVVRGDVAFELNGQPVVLMYGDRPAWRPLTEEADDGADIAQLEANLVALGYSNGDLTVDETFDEDTTAAVEAWQEALGVEETGNVLTDAVVFTPGPIRVGELLTDVGSVLSPGLPVYNTSSESREVLVLLDANDQDLIAEGDTVTVDLPEDVVETGTVRTVSRVVITDGQGPDATRVVEVFIDVAGSTGDIDETPVDVNVVSSEAIAVLAVPVESLLALAEGGYAVELESGTLVQVELGKFADGFVEVTGEISEGDRVVVPE